jgi:hypothetical protein
VFTDPRVAAGFLAEAGEQRLDVDVEEADAFVDGDAVPEPAVDAHCGRREEFRSVGEPGGDAIRQRRGGGGRRRRSSRLRVEGKRGERAEKEELTEVHA